MNSPKFSLETADANEYFRKGESAYLMTIADHTDSAYHDEKQYVANPTGNTQSDRDVTKHLRLLGRVESSLHVSGCYLSVYLCRKDYTDDAKW